MVWSRIKKKIPLLQGTNNGKKEERSVQDLLPVLNIEKDLVIARDGSVAIGFEVDLPEVEEFEGGGHIETANALERTLHGIPTDGIVQKLDIYYDRPYRSEDSGSELGFFGRRSEDHFLGRPMLFHRCFVFISVPPVGGKRRKLNPVSSPFSNFVWTLKENPLEGVQERMVDAEEIGKSFVDQLGGSGLRFRRIEEDEIKELFGRMADLEFDGESREDRTISHEGNGLSIGEKKVNIVSMVGQAEEVDQPVMNGRGVVSGFAHPLGIDLQFPHITATTLWKEDRAKVLSKIDIDKIMNSATTGPRNEQAHVRKEQLDEFTRELRANRSGVVSVSKQVLYWSLGDRKRAERTNDVLGAFRSMGAQAMVESFDLLNAWGSMFPGGGGFGHRFYLMPQRIGVQYFDWATNFRGKEKGDLICDRFQNPMRIQLFDKSLNNQNAIVVGPTGSGKSFTMAHFIIQRHERGERQVILDIGGTYKNAIRSLNGVYYEYDPDDQENPLEFNPFLVPKDDKGKWRITDDKVNFLIGFLAQLWKGEEGIKQVEHSLFLEWIPEYYHQEKDRPTLAGFRSFIENKEKEGGERMESAKQHFNVSEFLKVLEPYTVGKYKALLNSDNATDISDYPLVCFDLQRVKDDEQLYPLVVMLLAELSMDMVRKHPEDVKYLNLDECWDMLGGAMSSVIEYFYRTIRKNNGSITIITQGIDEIVNSKVGPAIVQNSDTRIILYHSDPLQIDKLGTHLGFTSHELQKIKSMRKGQKAREVFIKQGFKNNVFALEAPLEEHAVVTSQPDERNFFQRMLEKYEYPAFAIEEWVEHKEANKI